MKYTTIELPNGSRVKIDGSSTSPINMMVAHALAKAEREDEQKRVARERSKRDNA